MDRMIEKFKVNECCCFELRTGALIILWLSLILSVPGTILIIFPLMGIYGIYSVIKVNILYSFNIESDDLLLNFPGK